MLLESQAIGMVVVGRSWANCSSRGSLGKVLLLHGIVSMCGCVPVCLYFGNNASSRLAKVFTDFPMQQMIFIGKFVSLIQVKAVLIIVNS